jgi:hypothetical protein
MHLVHKFITQKKSKMMMLQLHKWQFGLTINGLQTPQKNPQKNQKRRHKDDNVIKASKE